MNASLIYEILMYLNSFYFGMYAPFELFVVLMKTFLISNFEANFLYREVVVLLFFYVVEAVRIVLGRKSSLSNQAWQAIASVVLTLPSLMTVIYLCCFQAIVLKLEIILSALLIALQCAELVSASIFVCSIFRPETYY